jgi:ubiquinone/menaquinone biosynthesis C-methylase UbiE/uncharacterized protein YbaR (Trm112 family)
MVIIIQKSNIAFKNLICPKCKGKLVEDLDLYLYCDSCLVKYPIIHGIPSFLPELEMLHWNNYSKNEYIPLLSNPCRGKFTYNCDICEKEYFSKELTESDYYVKFFDKDWKTILDLGCGDGYYTSSIAKIFDETSFFCVDTSIIALKRLQLRQHPNMHPLNANGMELPFPDDFFDAIFCIFMIEHVNKPILLLKEINRVLHRDGKLILVTDSKFYYRYFRIILEIIQYGHFRPDDPTHISLMNQRKLKILTEKSGFKLDRNDTQYFEYSIFSKFFTSIMKDYFLSTVIIFELSPI